MLRDLTELFAAATLAAPDGLAALTRAEALEHPGDQSDRVECPHCHHDDLFFETDALTGTVSEGCACGYHAPLSRRAGEARYREDQRHLARECLPFKLPAQHRGIRVTCSLAA